MSKTEEFDLVGKLDAIEKISIDSEQETEVRLKSDIMLDCSYYQDLDGSIVISIKDLIKKLKAFSELSDSENINISIETDKVLDYYSNSSKEYTSKRYLRKNCLIISNFVNKKDERDYKMAYAMNAKKVEKVIIEMEKFELERSEEKDES